MTTITAADADLLNAMGQQAMATPPPAAPALPQVNYTLPDTFVTLPGGYFGASGFTTEAEVRELTGHDEEALAKAPNGGRMLMMILERGTVKIGEEKSTRAILDDVLMGDREMLLLAIARATFGDMKVHAVCSSCQATHEYTIDLSNDVPVVRLENPNDRFFTVNCRKGPVKVSLPVGSTHRTLWTAADKSGAELNSIMLADCLMEVNGIPAMGITTAQNLGLRDRAMIEEEISARNPGPRLDKVKKACASCGGDVNIPLTLANLFRI